MAETTGTKWIDIDTKHPEQLALLTDVYKFHPLAIEDCLNPKSRVKLDEYDGYIFLIVRAVRLCEETEDPYDVETINVCFFLGKDYLVTVHTGPVTAIDLFRGLLDRNQELAKSSPARLLHAIVDQTVDAFFPVIDKLDEFMDGLEDRIFAKFDHTALQDIFSVKRLVVTLRRHLAPQRDVFTILSNRPTPYIPPEAQIYFRDTYDHVLRINDALESFRDLLSSTLDSYLTQISNRLGTVTKTLSVYATLSIPFVVVSGMWGMNVPVPFANSAHGFWTLLVIQLVVGGTLLGILKWRELL